jgi:hypothetical protein
MGEDAVKYARAGAVAPFGDYSRAARKTSLARAANCVGRLNRRLAHHCIAPPRR